MAEDIAQDVFFRAWKSFERFDGRYPRAWLRVLVKFAIADKVKHQTRACRRGTTVPLLPIDATNEPSPEFLAEVQERQEQGAGVKKRRWHGKKRPCLWTREPTKAEQERAAKRHKLRKGLGGAWAVYRDHSVKFITMLAAAPESQQVAWLKQRTRPTICVPCIFGRDNECEGGDCCCICADVLDVHRMRGEEASSGDLRSQSLPDHREIASNGSRDGRTV